MVVYTTLESLLKECKLPKQSSDVPTHTKITGGKYAVPNELLPQLMELFYKDVFEQEKECTLTEANSKITQLKVDIDFRYTEADNSARRRYQPEDIEALVKLYSKHINKYLHVARPNAVCYVFEKSGPTFDPKGKLDPKTGLMIIKDGIHLMFPGIITHAIIAHKIREDILTEIDQIFGKYQFVNSYKDIVDISVVESNNWFMYGARKPNSLAYEVSTIYKYNIEPDTDIISLTKMPVQPPSVDYVRLFSILNKDKLPWRNAIKMEYVTLLEPEGQQIKSEYIKHKEDSRKKTKRVLKKSPDEVRMVMKLVDLLSPERANEYRSWIDIGWCLHNIHTADDQLLEKWIEFSKQAPQYYDSAEQTCRDTWVNMREEGLGIGTLIHWVKTDNPDGYKKLQEEDITLMIRTYIQKNKLEHNDVGKIFFQHYKHNYVAVCKSKSKYVWYEFTNHRWSELGSHSKIRRNLSDKLSEMFSIECGYFNGIANAKGMEDPNYSQWQEFSGRALKISQKLRQGAFKNSVITECQDEFVDEAKNFIEKMDENTMLLGCNNGVYDLNRLEFREGRPDDLITYSTKIHFDETITMTDPRIIDIKNFVRQVLPDKSVRNYVMKIFATCLDGTTKREKFYILTGTGGNGKSKLIELFDLAMGDYSKNVSVSLLTKKRADSNAAQPELAVTKGRRIIKFQEAEENSKLNVGLMKELTGGDKVVCRGLFQDPIEFKPQFTPFFICNDKPELPPHDDGTWRRVRIIDFPSKFIPAEQNPDPTKNEFPIDYELSEKIKEWGEAFLWLLVEHYKEYRKSGIVEPSKVMEYTNHYRKKIDIYNTFVNETIAQEINARLYLNDLYKVYRDWHKENYAGTGIKPEKKDKLREYIIRRYGPEYDQTQCIHKSANQRTGVCWLGYKLIDTVDENESSVNGMMNMLIDEAAYNDDLDAKKSRQ